MWFIMFWATTDKTYNQKVSDSRVGKRTFTHGDQDDDCRWRL